MNVSSPFLHDVEFVAAQGGITGGDWRSGDTYRR